MPETFVTSRMGHRHNIRKFSAVIKENSGELSTGKRLGAFGLNQGRACEYSGFLKNYQHQVLRSTSETAFRLRQTWNGWKLFEVPMVRSARVTHTRCQGDGTTPLSWVTMNGKGPDPLNMG